MTLARAFADASKACRCEMCAPADPGPTYTRAFRHECEVRHVARMPSKEHRKRYLGMVADQRGTDAAQAIIAGLKSIKSAADAAHQGA